MGKIHGLRRFICIFLVILLIGVICSQYISVDFFSKKAEKIRPTISILNVQSYPKVGGLWTVSFEVKGTADLIISPIDGTTWSEDDNCDCDIIFQYLKNDEESLAYAWDDNQIIIKNFSSENKLYEASKVYTLGKHVLKFSFGDDVAYAYNDASNWWNTSWGFRKKITINSSQVEGILTNFPVLVNISDMDLQQKANLNGNDIAFISYEDNSSKFSHEIENYSNGNLTAWVTIPYVSSLENVSFWMYYNNTGSSNQENPMAVWDSNYIGVWHLSESGTGTRFDSTQYWNNGTTVNYDGDEATDGQIDGADDLDGTSDFLNLSDLDLLAANFTLKAWIRPSVSSQERIIFGKEQEGNNSCQFRLALDTSDYLFFMISNSDNSDSLWSGGYSLISPNPLTENSWIQIDVTRSGTGYTLYLDGQSVDTASTSTIINHNNNYDLYFGARRANDGSPSLFFDGIMDEVRISNISRNHSWIKTSYNTIQNQSQFISIDSEESSSPVISNPVPSDYNEKVATTPSYFEITVFDPNPDMLNITWRTNASGIWKTFNITNGSGSGVTDGTYQVINTSWASVYSNPYWWSVNVTDGLHWSNQTYQFTLHQYTPKINSFIIANNTGVKSNNQTGRLSVQQPYYFLINATDNNGWDDIDYINVTCWYDQGNDSATYYNKTKGGNINMFLQYQNTTGTASYDVLWPSSEIYFSSENCTESIINETTRIINISFWPGVQFRYAISNNTWNTTVNDYNDLYSWNINCSISDSSNNRISRKDEFGVNWYSTISATETIEINGAPGMNTASSIMVVTYSCNYNYHLFVYMDANFSQISGSDIIDVAGNLTMLENADLDDELTENTTFTGIGELHKITLFYTNALNNGTSSSVDVQFELSIPFGTWGKYTSTVVKKLQRVD